MLDIGSACCLHLSRASYAYITGELLKYSGDQGLIHVPLKHSVALKGLTLPEGRLEARQEEGRLICSGGEKADFDDPPKSAA